MHRLAGLSFAEKSATGQIITLWSQREMPWAAGNAEGRRRADEMVALMQVNEAPVLFTHVMSAIVAHGAEPGSVEVGFFSRIAALAMESEVPVQAGQPRLSLVGTDD